MVAMSYTPSTIKLYKAPPRVVNLTNARALIDRDEKRQVVLVAALVAIRRRSLDVLLRAATAVRKAVAPVVIAGLLAAGPQPVALLPSRCHSTTRVGWLQWVATHRHWYDIPSGPPIALPATVPAVATIPDSRSVTIDTTPLVEASKRQAFERAIALSNTAAIDTPRSRWEASGVAAQKEAQAIKEREGEAVLVKISPAADCLKHPVPTATPKPNGHTPHPLTETERLYAARWGDHPTVEAAQQAYRAWIAHSRAMSRSDTRGLDDVVDVADAMDRQSALRVKAYLAKAAGREAVG